MDNKIIINRSRCTLESLHDVLVILLLKIIIYRDKNIGNGKDQFICVFQVNPSYLVNIKANKLWLSVCIDLSGTIY